MLTVSDTSPISNLIQIGRLELLKSLFKNIVIPPYVDQEVQALSRFGYNLSEYENAQWIKICELDKDVLLNELEKDLDKGEAAAIVLSKELGADLLLIDERLGTKQANVLGLKTIGLLGCLLACKRQGIIHDVMPIVEQLEETAGFYVGKKLKHLIRKLSSEI
ncbi:MAG: DUF3368 domain-containing protein [Bacteroidota bacterium]